MTSKSSMISAENSGDNANPHPIFGSIHDIIVGINGLSPDISARIANISNLGDIISYVHFEKLWHGFIARE